jgi:RNA polymerase primary sigma factor
MKAAYRFDCSKARFTTYASFWIRQRLGRAIVDQSQTIRLPLHLHDQRNRFYKYYSRMHNEYECVPCDKAVSLRSGVSMRTVKQIRETPLTTSLEAPISGNTDKCLADVVADKQSTSACEILNRKKIQAEIKNILSELEPREVKVLRLRFGINETKSHTLIEVGRKLGVSRERIRQIEKKALNRLRHPVRRNKLSSLL